MLSPTERPTPLELRNAKVLHESVSNGTRIIRYQISEADPVPAESGHCVRMACIVEVHIPNDCGPATWWRVFGG